MTSPWEITAVALALAYLVLAIRQSPWCWPAAIASTAIYIFLMYDAGLYMESALQVFYIAIAVYGWRAWTTRTADKSNPGRSGFSREKELPPPPFGRSGFSRDRNPPPPLSGDDSFSHDTKTRPPLFGGNGVSRDQTTTGAQSSPPPLAVTTWPWRSHVMAIIAIVLASALSGALLTRYTEAAFPYADSFTTWGAIVTTWMVARKILENWLYWFVIDSVSVFLYVSRELYLTAGLFLIYLVMVVIGYRAWRRSMQVAATESIGDRAARPTPGR